MTILDEIIQYKKNVELPKQMQKHPLADVQAEAMLSPKPADFVAALRSKPGVALIAEAKKASPSKGLLCPNFDPIQLATTYADNGAAAMSILTDARYFQGKLDYLRDINQHLQATKRVMPLLRKDFIVDRYQIHEARLAGAAAVLLIAAVLNDDEIAMLYTLTQKIGLTALIEVHDKIELERILPLKPTLVGVNNRNLHDFSVDLNTCIELRQYVPDTICFVAESGIHTADDVSRLVKEGVDAILVGEAIVKSKDVASKVRELAVC